MTAILAVFNTAYVLTGVPPSSPAQLIASYTLPICFVTWIQVDARSRRRTPCFDFGMFILATWTLSVPWYLIWTRGWRGMLLALMFLVLLVVPGVVATLVWTALVMSTAQIG